MEIPLINLIKKFPQQCFSWISNPFIMKIIKIFPKDSIKFVGGCVRDSLLGIKTKDVDMGTTLLPDQIIQLLSIYFSCIKTIGRDHGTISIYGKEYKIEITTLREDVKTMGRQAIVKFGIDWKKDSERRDFTINSLYYDYNNKSIIDYNNGIQDLYNKQINFILNGEQRIKEDYLRIIRYIRFFGRYSNNNNIPLPIINLLQKHIDGLFLISKERIFQEINIMICHDNWKNYIKLLNIINLPKKIFNMTWDHSNLLDTNNMEERWLMILYMGDVNIIKTLMIPKNIKKNILKIKYLNIIDKNSIFENLDIIFQLDNKILDLLEFYFKFMVKDMDIFVYIKIFLNCPKRQEMITFKRQDIIQKYTKNNIKIELNKLYKQLGQEFIGEYMMYYKVLCNNANVQIDPFRFIK